MHLGSGGRRARLMAGTAFAIAMVAAGGASAEAINIEAQPLTSALNEFGHQTNLSVVYTPDLTSQKSTSGVVNSNDPEAALRQLLAGTNLTYRRSGDAFLIEQEGGSDPQSGSAAGDGAEVDALIVTAQKREEDIQDVPIAISAFTQESLERAQIAGGPDLMTQIPNMTFTKTNFASYSIQIRGIGTQAISATTDAAVAVAFNNSSLIRNRFFEQEFYDLERVEVLRGPQGTLYGRNATAGVVNIISAKPTFNIEAKASADVANYSSTRLEGMVNIPLVEDVVALRLAGAWTKRDGYVTNEITGNPIDGRDLWSTRLSLRFAPTDAINVNLIWEHFEEDDDRLRSGKQLCKTDDRTEINGVPRELNIGISYSQPFSQGCLPASLYAPESFQVPDGMSLPYYLPLRAIRMPAFAGRNPYLSTTQSRDLRVIESTVDPQYRAKSDVSEIQVSIDLTDNLTFVSETLYSADELFSSQDYNRFNTAPGVFDQAYYDIAGSVPSILVNGVFCDPQIGCADRLVAMDLSTAESRQFSQEIRLSSDYDAPFNFSLGGNFLRYDTEDKYYVFINTLGLYTAMTYGIWGGGGAPMYEPGVSDNRGCFSDREGGPPNPEIFESLQGCIYMDPNPISSLNDQGHNYFLSRNPYKLISYAVFGEAYYNITPDLKLTGGLRLTIDRKTAPRIPSWLLAARTIGLTVAETIEQEWREPTGRLALDWKPALSFTDETLLYASYARGYKAGGANPPAAGVVSWLDDDIVENLSAQSAAHPKTFAPEFVNAFEIGSKNTLLDGSLTLNFGAFYYDYTGYQISYIVNRSAVNLNFDAEIWGLELEADWRPLENLRLGFKGGYESTRVADGSKAIDVMDRTAGSPDWIVVRPFPTFPSNCILPMSTVTDNTGARLTHNPALFTGGVAGPCEYAYALGLDPVTRLPYVSDPTDWSYAGQIVRMPDSWIGYEGFNPLDASQGHNNGEGFYKDLSGNELPNAPHFTATITGDYTIPLPNEWLATLHADLYYQSEAWTRIFNTEGYDKLKAYTNVNLAAIFTNEDAGWKVMAYVKNVMDRDSITGAFLNSDDSGLTTNVFLTEPRLYGLRVTKEWTGGGFLGLGDGSRRAPGTPYPFQIGIGGRVSRFDNSVETYAPAWLSSTLAPVLSVQEDDLDWGDIRDVKVTYAPANGWRIAAAYLYGKTNGSHLGLVHEDVPGATNSFSHNYIERDNDARVTVEDTEEFAVADFMVGKEIGLGAWGEGGRSVVSAGLRYASFKSTSRVVIDGHSEGYVAPVLTKYTGQFRERANTTSLDSIREFEGTGPVLSWDSAVKLFGDDERGHVDLDWTVAGGVLFGKQTMSSSEDRWAEYRSVNPTITTTLYDETDVLRQRTEDVTVPNLSLSLGLSYAIDRVKISTGYSYDRFFDAIDGGYDEARSYDRTIHGPYLRLSLGFGG